MSKNPELIFHSNPIMQQHMPSSYINIQFYIQAMEDNAAVTGGDAVNSSPIGTGSGIEEAFTAREDEEFCEVSPLLREKGGLMYAPDRPPPLWDFLTVVTAFFVAVVAAYYTISVVEA